MRRWLSFAAAAILTVFLALPASAGKFDPTCGAPGSGPCQSTQNLHSQSQTIYDYVPCSVNPTTGVGIASRIDLTSVNEVFHINVNAAQDFWATGTLEGDFFIQPVKATLSAPDANGNRTPTPLNPPAVPGAVTYSGHFAIWFGISDNLNNSVAHSTFNIAGTGSDGSTLTAHAVFHLSMSASGLVVFFDRMSC
jgi:hypothetical protein